VLDVLQAIFTIEKEKQRAKNVKVMFFDTELSSQ
jgi:hypothetical protein